MTVISDTSPLRYLSLLGKVEVLPLLFGKVWCTATVRSECLHPRAPQTLRSLFESPPAWLIVVDDPPAAGSLEKLLDPGESTAITLALSHAPGSLLLMDERKGRQVAEGLGLRVAGTVNIIALAGVRGLLDYQQAILELRETTNFRMHESLIQQAWDLAAREG